MLKEQLSFLEKAIEQALQQDPGQNDIEESGTVLFIDSGIASVKGLKNVQNQELIQF